MTRTAIVIPLRGLHGGKSRLAPILDPLQRTMLVRAMAWHVLSVALTTEVDGPVYLVTRDHDLDWLVGTGDERVRVLCQPLSHPGMNAAIDVGRDAAMANGAERLLVLSADLPLLASEDLATVLASGATITIAPDRGGTGTNALLLASRRAVSQFEFHFGVGSRQRHQEEAVRLDLDHTLVIAPGIQVDLDTPADWAMLTPETRKRLLQPRKHILSAREPVPILEHA